MARVKRSEPGDKRNPRIPNFGISYAVLPSPSRTLMLRRRGKLRMVSGIWSYVPSFDGQTTASIVIGIVVSFWTYWLSYKRTIGAQDERVRSTSNELISSVIKRVAVEREVMSHVQFRTIRRAKAYRAQIDNDRLISFDDARAVVLSDVIDNNFLDQVAKSAIIDLLDKSGEDRPALTEIDSKNPAEDKRIRLKRTQLRLAALSFGAAATLSINAVSNWLRRYGNEIEFVGPAELAMLFSIIAAAAIVLLGSYLVIPWWLRKSEEQQMANKQALLKE
ncbi:hypothetical protein SAMN04488115_107202 [Bosea lathyri]|uniref:Uncharacterized protein n=2 Tax=Bosea lathyri TaxID=1036778 RepID=A0A1H6BFG0_9HYPH|nr:hypothetical protein SAMN04488115_107202 [Bosea lathyri]